MDSDREDEDDEEKNDEKEDSDREDDAEAGFGPEGILVMPVCLYGVVWEVGSVSRFPDCFEVPF